MKFVVSKGPLDKKKNWRIFKRLRLVFSDLLDNRTDRDHIQPSYIPQIRYYFLGGGGRENVLSNYLSRSRLTKSWVPLLKSIWLININLPRQKSIINCCPPPWLKYQYKPSIAVKYWQTEHVLVIDFFFFFLIRYSTVNVWVIQHKFEPF